MDIKSGHCREKRHCKLPIVISKYYLLLGWDVSLYGLGIETHTQSYHLWHPQSHSNVRIANIHNIYCFLQSCIPTREFWWTFTNLADFFISCLFYSFIQIIVFPLLLEGEIKLLAAPGITCVWWAFTTFGVDVTGNTDVLFSRFLRSRVLSSFC